MSLDEQKVEAFVGQVVADAGATVSSALAHLGTRLGLYRAMAGAGPLTPEELAQRTGTHARYVREWLDNQAAGGYVTHTPADGTYALPPEHAVVLAEPDSPVHMAAAWQQMAAVWALEPSLEAAFRSGEGIGWHEQDPRMFSSVEAFFAPAYRASLVDDWLPALDGVADRLAAGGRVADVGCGHGAASILLAQAFPAAEVTGFDSHEDSITTARKRSADAGLTGGRLRFEVADAQGYPVPDGGYDLICMFDALHDFGDPVGAAAHAREALAEDGTLMLVEINSADRPEDNHHVLGRLAYGMSTVVCTPTALSQDGGYALGGQAGPSAIARVVEEGGFGRCRVAARGPVHQVIEVRP